MIYAGTRVSKDGIAVPQFEGGRAMFSLYNARRDAESFAAQFSAGCGFAVVGGLGNAMHLLALMESRPAAQILCVENSDSDIDFCKKNFDIPKEVVVCPAEEIFSAICASYLPALHGDLEFFCVRSWLERCPQESLRLIRENLNAAIGECRADYSVQAHFGLQWHRNILLNLKSGLGRDSEPQEEIFRAAKDGKTAAVIAAGPSLDRSAEELTKNREKYFVIAADTAFRALARRKIRCDAVASVDGQLVSRSHFMPFDTEEENSFFKGVIFVFDLTARPDAARAAASVGGRILFSSNGHPLSSLAEEGAGGILHLGTGAGSVAIAAAELAARAGFRKIRAFGADFGYPDGKPYTKGTYLCDIYGSGSWRAQNSETMFDALMYRTELKSGADGVLTSPVLERYRASFEKALEGLGYGRRGATFENPNARPSEAKKPLCKAEQFLSEYAVRLERAAKLFENSSIKFRESSELLSILPLIAALKFNLKINEISCALQLAYSKSLRYTCN